MQRNQKNKQIMLQFLMISQAYANRLHNKSLPLQRNSEVVPFKIVFTMSKKRPCNWLEDLATLEDFHPISFNDLYNHEVYKCSLIQYR